MFKNELARAGVVYFGPVRHSGSLFDRTVALAKDKSGPLLKPVRLNEMAKPGGAMA